MAHDDDAVTLFDKVAQGVGDDAAAHMTALFDTVGDTTVEFKAVHGLHRRLVAASAEGNIDALAGHLVTFLQSLAAVTYADGQRGKAAGMQRAHLVKNFKPFLQHPVDVAFLHYRNVAAVGDLAQETGAFGDVRFQQTVDGFQLLGLLAVLHVVEQFIVAVDHDDQAGGAAGGVFLQRLFINGIVHKVDDVGPAAALGCTCVGGEPLVPYAQVLTVGAAADRKVQFREKPVDRPGHGIGAVQHFLPEDSIIPQHAAVCNQHRGDGQAGQAVLDAAVLKVRTAKVFGHKGAQTAALIPQYAQRCNDQHGRGNEPFGRQQRHRHGQSRAGNEQQQDDRCQIQALLLLHGKSLTFLHQFGWSYTSSRMGRIIGLRLVLR